MTLRELREKINNVDSKFDDYLVVLQKDSEGNRFSPSCGIDLTGNIYVTEGRCGQVYPDKYNKDYFEDEEEFEEFKKSGIPCVVLWPNS